jgi:hypothetical protein
MIKNHFTCVAIIFLLLFLAGNYCSVHASIFRHDSTIWVLKPSFTFDALTFLNTLSGDPFYQKYYQEEFASFDTLITPTAREALVSLKRRIKDEGGNIISAFLTLYFSATEAETLDDMLATLRNSETMRKHLQKTPYYSDGGWKLYVSVQPELKTIFEFLRQIDFPRYWRERVLPRVSDKIRELEPQLPRYDVIGEDERLLGRSLTSDTITVYLLYFSQPHGIRITGTRFLTDVAWPFSIVLRNAVHEMMHPPYDLAADSELRKTLELLKGDEFLMDKVDHHNPSFGYNSFEGFIEEDVVQALEQLANERFEIAKDARTRWTENDDGMHVFAVALYTTMKTMKFEDSGLRFRDFLIREVNEGSLKPGRIRDHYAQFYGTPGPNK